MKPITSKRISILVPIIGNLKSEIANCVFASLSHSLLWGCGSAQQPKKIPRIGYLSLLDPADESTRSEPIRLALRERGYVEGQNIAIEYRYAEGKRDRIPELAAESGASQGRYHRGSRRDPTDRGDQECDQDDSHRYDEPFGRSCRGGPG